MKKLFTTRDLSIALRMRMIRAYVFPVLLFGVESWTLTEATLKRLQAFEMWLYRRMMRVSWVKIITNEEVLRRMHKDTEVVNTVKQRKHEYFGHIMRKVCHSTSYNTG